MRLTRKRALATMLVVGGLMVAACGSSSSSSTTTTSATSTTTPSVSATSFTTDFSEMTKLKSLASSGKGSVAVILPDTVSSARYTEFDAPVPHQGLPDGRVDLVAVHRPERTGQ